MSTEGKRCCPWCNRSLKGAHPNKKFCSKRHKDKYWNTVNPRGKFSHLHPDNRKVDDVVDDVDGDAYFNSDFGDQKE